jgi:hypothetical protein
VTGRYTVNISAPSLATPFTEKINVGQSVAGGPNTGQPDQIVLSWTDDPEATQAVSWRTNNTMQDEVEYWPVNNSAGAQEVTAPWNATYSVYCPGCYRFQATIQGLSPGTSYEYQVGGDGVWSQPATFTTAAPYGDFSFLYMGDVQQGYPEWGDMLQVAAGENPKFALLGGDIVGDSSGSAAVSEWQQFFAAAAPLFSRVSLMPAAGNHDDGPLEWSSFAVPQNGPSGYAGFYSFDYENCHVAVLDSNDLTASGSGQYNTISAWLENDLNSSGKTWKFVVLHYPPYEIYPDSRLPIINRYWAPIFEQCGVDMVFDGHQQVYARTSPMKNGQIQPDGSGTVYVMGNAGTFYYHIGPYFNYLVKESANYSNYEAVNVDGANLTMTAKDANGNVIDSYQLTKQVVPVLTTLALSGSPGLTYSGQPLACDLTGSSGLTLTGFDQNGNPFDLGGATVTWAVYSGPATLNSDGHTLTITGSGTVSVTASVYGIASNVLDFTVGGRTTAVEETLYPDAGGTVSLGDEASVAIPANALTGTGGAHVQITQDSNPPAAASGYMVLDSGFDFTVNGAGYPFKEPVTLTFTFDPASLPQGVPAVDLAVYYYTGSGWQPVPGAPTVSGDTISVQVDHFTEFAVISPVSTSPGNQGGTESFPILLATPSYFEQGLYISGDE